MTTLTLEQMRADLAKILLEDPADIHECHDTGQPLAGGGRSAGLLGNGAEPHAGPLVDTDSAGRLTPPDSLSHFAPFPFAADP